ncbi:MAG: hypothetical protein DMD78_23090 [Candidatus Rokuibacteriota bacterium]|nr:MAG: hypothetical protein DMD78_23090 [Candidatus Rokubacteria bacterium]
MPAAGPACPSRAASPSRSASPAWTSRQAQVARARRLVPAARFVCADVRAPGLRDARFDAICSYYAIIHIPREDHAALFGRLARLLKPGGLALFCVGAEDLPYSAETYLGVPMAWSHFDAATNERLIEAAGLQIEWTERVADTGAPGAGHLFVLARRSAVSAPRCAED